MRADAQSYAERNSWNAHEELMRHKAVYHFSDGVIYNAVGDISYANLF